MRLLVPGANGMLGQDLMGVAERAGHEVLGLDLPELDITDPASVDAAFARFAPDAVVNCAAYTNVDRAEEDEATALAVNGDGAGNLARAAAAHGGAFVVQVSTDYVFRGDATEPYPEDAPVDPLGAYGRTKLAGEQQVAESGAPYAIARTAWLFGVHGPNFPATMLKLARDRDELSVVDDQVGGPTYAGHLAPALLEIAERRSEGVHHTAGAGQVSWCGFARAIFEGAGLADRVTVKPVTSAEFVRPAPRPAFSVFAVTRSDTPRLPPWQDGLDAYLRHFDLPGAS